MPIISGSTGAIATGGSVVGSAFQAADVSTAGTTFAAGANVLTTAITFTADGTSAYLACLSAVGQINSASGQNLLATVLDGAQATGQMGFWQLYSATGSLPCYAAQPLTGLSAAAHTVNVRLYVSAGTGKLYSGTTFAGAQIVVYVMRLG